MAAMPYFVFVELLGPVIELFGYCAMVLLFALGRLHLDVAVLFFIVALFYGIMYSVGAVLLEELSFRRYPNSRDLAVLLAMGVIENFGYRQITAWWRVRAVWDFFRGNKQWGTLQRKGFSVGKK
jgi:hypothetical protein